MHLFWHRRDLRVPDNRGLAAATADDTTLPVYIVDHDMLERLGRRQRAFMIEGVRALKARYQELGSDLLIREGPPATTLARVAEEYDADTVYYNHHYRPARRHRQQQVDEGLSTRCSIDLTLVDPADLAPSYPNHSQFHTDWQAKPKPTPAVVQRDALAAVDDETTIDDIPISEEATVDDAAPNPDATDSDRPAAGYAAARDRYDSFLADGIETYDDTRDDMQAAVERPVGAVSRLSPYLAAGMIGIREVWADATEHYDAADKNADDERAARNIEKYRYELSWREQNYHLLHYNPTLLTENYKSLPNRIAWENDPDEIAAWKAGETGYPLVDAGMRQLNQEGYIHNRPRQNVASFSTKHLLIDWRIGARYFAEQLLDHDPANNYANWQWIASTGTDSVDVRIFDPVAQLSKYDPDADYVTEYVPELRGVDSDAIVEWPTLSAERRDRLAPEYPEPIVDRDAAYECAQRVFETALGKR
jgi:deoxyribodipyrimidine photo-lyase